VWEFVGQRMWLVGVFQSCVVVIQSELVRMVEGQMWLCLGFLWVER
jgi:hypothetical protein